MSDDQELVHLVAGPEGYAGVRCEVCGRFVVAGEGEIATATVEWFRASHRRCTMGSGGQPRPPEPPVAQTVDSGDERPSSGSESARKTSSKRQ